MTETLTNKEKKKQYDSLVESDMNIVNKTKHGVIIQGDTLKVMDELISKGVKVDRVMTSPPYNNSKQGGSIDNHETRYDICFDKMTNGEYCDWIVNIFNRYDKLLKKDGSIFFNMSYGSNNTEAMFLAISDIIRKTNFTIADKITWKKKSAIPNNVSKNKLTRIVEEIYVFCRKDESKTFNSNKQVKSVSVTGQNFYENIFNFIEAKNNDGSCKLNKATYSSELCTKIFDIYCNKGEMILDNFNGTGTTSIACIKNNLKYIGIELSEAQCEFAANRITELLKNG